MNFTPTKEQEMIIEAYKAGDDIVVEAGAGAAKSSSICLMAESCKDKTGLYLAFNKSIAEEINGKLPDYVESRTTHSLAYKAIGHKYQTKLSRPKGRYENVAGTPSEIAKYFRIMPFMDITDVEIAKLVKYTVAKFEYSACDSIGNRHIPVSMMEDTMKRAAKRNDQTQDKEGLQRAVLKYAEMLWQERTSIHSPVLATHDTYLKLYQLSKPVLDYDVVFLDEAQDTNLTVLDIFNRQTAQKVIVGDNNQAIYQWRGSMNAMKKVVGTSLKLSQSFRFGEKIAEVANTILEGNTSLILKGTPSIESKVWSQSDLDEGSIKFEQYTLISRTNGSLLNNAIDLLSRGESVNIEINTGDFVRKLEQVIHLYKGEMNKVKHEDLIGFNDWKELMDEAENDADLSRMSRLVLSGRAYSALSLLRGYRKSHNPTVTLITGHKSKGLEWDNVVLDSDFPDTTEIDVIPDAERNLMYVACTRAKCNLVLPDNMQSLVDGFYSFNLSGDEPRADMAAFTNEMEFEREANEQADYERGVRAYIGK